jgi:hypothetical protein
MTFPEMKHLVERWFAEFARAGVVLPRGWFGRPYDIGFALCKVSIDGHSLTVYLEEGLTLAFTGLASVSISESELVFGGFTNLQFHWKEFGGNETHNERYESGAVRFVPPIGTRVAKL